VSRKRYIEYRDRPLSLCKAPLCHSAIWPKRTKRISHPVRFISGDLIWQIVTPLPEIADDVDGTAVDDVTDKHPRLLAFDVFAEDENRLVNNGQPSAKRLRRVSSASSSIRPEDLNRKETMLDCHEWQAQRIVGERQKHRQGWSTKSASRRQYGCRGRRFSRNWCGGIGQSSGQRLESARGGRHGCRARSRSIT
jgi:hypothetical protein